jgi:hypothetical protein
MLAILHLLVMFVADIFKSRRRLEAENLFLRHQLNIGIEVSAASSAAARQTCRVAGAFDVVENIVEVTLTQLVAAGACHEESPW